MKPIAKSLHTITVIVQVAKLLHRKNPTIGIEGAVTAALEALQLQGKPDTYGLATRAMMLMFK